MLKEYVLVNDMGVYADDPDKVPVRHEYGEDTYLLLPGLDFNNMINIKNNSAYPLVQATRADAAMMLYKIITMINLKP